MAMIGVMLMFLIQLSVLAQTRGACENCAKCQGSYRCLFCNHVYFLSNGICTMCQANCQYCHNETTCAYCFIGFYLDTDTGLCPACRSACKSCDSYEVCRICEDTYFLDDYKCITCPITCPTCVSSTRCTSCYQGYWGSTNCSNSCPGECKDRTCDIYGLCVECLDGKWGRKCQYSCPENCLDNKCSIVGDSCIDGCMPGFYGRFCDITCPFNCSTNVCFENGECTTGCKAGFYGDYCNQTCLSTTCPNNECFQNNGSCKTPCPETCLSCTSSISCTSCKQGHYGTMCENPCPDSNCKECSQETGTCLKCEGGHFLSGTVCILCEIGCDTCEGPTNCLSCAKGYYLENNQCKSCNNDCLDCTRGDNCNVCQAGYFIGTAKCTQCPPNCKTCISMNQCTACIDGYQGITCDSFVCADQKYSTSSGTDSCECDKHKCSNKNGDSCLACTDAGWYPSGPGCCPCADGTYENNGCITCPEHCIPKGQCNVSTGTCKEGCEDRWWGLKCDQRCNDTCVSCLRDGICVTCNQNCQSINGILSCDNDTGRCNGCKPGYFGTQCTNECSDGCGEDDDEYRSCRQEDGGCEFGCEIGFYRRTCAEKDSSSSSALVGGVVGGIVAALIIAAVVVVCFIRRKSLGCLGNKKESTGNQPVDETVGGVSGNGVEYVALQERSGSDGFYNQLGLTDESLYPYAALEDQSRDKGTYSELQTGTRNDHVVTTPAEYENMTDPPGFGKQYENMANPSCYGKQYENV